MFNKMIGFKTNSGILPDVLFQMNTYCDWDRENKVNIPVFDIKIHPENKTHLWADQLDFSQLGDLMAKDKSRNYHSRKYNNWVEVGTWFEMNSYTNDRFIAIRSSSDALAQQVALAIAKNHQPLEKGINDPYYTPRGLQKKRDGEWIYHQSSYGIGD